MALARQGSEPFVLPKRRCFMLYLLAAEELKSEKLRLEQLLKKQKNYPRMTLLYAPRSDGRPRFYFRKPGDTMRTYIRKSQSDLLRNITYGAVVAKSIEIIRANITALEYLVSTYRPSDTDSVISALPSSYVRAVDVLRDSTPPEKAVIQSENPKNRDQLKHTVSNGLKVRSKGEVAICEELLIYGRTFWYEKALPLIVNRLQQDGTVISMNVIRYPDFTIPLHDGSMLYWEHCGMFSKDEYREDNIRKFTDYYDNGIYPPKNLIITMDDTDKPLDVRLIRQIIEYRILPFS